MKRKASSRKSWQNFNGFKGFNEALASFENIDPAIVGLTAAGEIVYVNRSACNLLGASKERLQGRPFGTIAPGMTAEAWSSFWSELDHGEIKPGLTTLHLSGKTKLSVEFRALFIHQSSLKYCLMTKSEQEPATAVNMEPHSWPLVQVLNSMTDHVTVLDDQHKVTFMNQALCQSMGISLAEALATTVYDYLPKREADIAWEHEQQALVSMQPSWRCGDEFLQAKYGDKVTMLPFLNPGSSQKRLLVILSGTLQTGRSLPAVIPESHERVPSLPKPGYVSELHEILERSAPLGIFLKNTENRYLWVNAALARMIGVEPKDLIGQRAEDLVHDSEILAIMRKEDDYIYSTGKPLFNQVAPLFNSQSGYYRLDKLPFINRNGKLVGIIGLVVEVDEPPAPIEALKKELASMSQKVQETETALRVLIERWEQDKSLTREELNAKVKDLVVPYLEHLKQTPLSPEQLEFIDLIETNLKNFYDPGYTRLSSPTYKLSATELKVAQLVRAGKTNKEIAQLLHLSKSTILTHRHHVRVKLGIKNKKVNLRSLLNS